MNSSEFKSNTPMEQAGLENLWHETDAIEYGLLTSVTLLRLHSLLPAEDLNSKLLDKGIVLPGSVGQAIGQDPTALCLAPREWLILSEYLTSNILLEQFQSAINPASTALIDVSSAYAVFRLSGPAAPWLLSKMCGLDFRSGIAAGQHCTRTRLDQAGAILHHHQPGSGAVPFVFDVILERSLARYGWQLICSNLPHALELEQQHGLLHE